VAWTGDFPSRAPTAGLWGARLPGAFGGLGRRCTAGAGSRGNRAVRGGVGAAADGGTAAAAPVARAGAAGARAGDQRSLRRARDGAARGGAARRRDAYVYIRPAIWRWEWGGGGRGSNFLQSRCGTQRCDPELVWSVENASKFKTCCSKSVAKSPVKRRFGCSPMCDPCGTALAASSLRRTSWLDAKAAQPGMEWELHS